MGGLGADRGHHVLVDEVVNSLPFSKNSWNKKDCAVSILVRARVKVAIRVEEERLSVQGKRG